MASAAWAAARIAGILILLAILTWSLVGEQSPLPRGTIAPPVLDARGLDGGPVELGFGSGKPAVVNLWATWCPPCLVELPAFASVSERHPEVHFYGLAVDSPPAQVARVVERMRIPYPIAVVSGSGVRSWNATALPSTFVLDREGRVTWSIRGAVDAELLEAKLLEAKLLEAKLLEARHESLADE